MSAKTLFTSLIGFAAALALSLAGRGWAAGMPKTSCEECHSQVAVAYQASIHTQAGMTCVTCHGGDPSDPQASAMDPRKGFRGKPSRRDIPRFCAKCHADRAQMQQYGLETHQFEDYQTSVHGKAWANGDTNVAVCSDCHSAHKILAPDNPNSTIFPMNVATTCGQCHSNKTLMAKYGLPADVVTKYQSSVHAQVLASGGRQSAPSCATCHGSHTALPPGAKDIPNICARCHVQVKDLIAQSPHQAAFSTGAMSCQNCHRHHDIQHPTDGDLLTACQGCHAKGSMAASTGQAIYDSIAKARADFGQVNGQIKALEKEGYLVEKLKDPVQDANTGLVQAIQLQHTMNPQAVDEKLVSTEGVARDIQVARDEYHAELQERKLVLIPLWAFIGLTALVIYWKRRKCEQCEHDDKQAEDHTERA